jgi:hypothetical protein
LSNGWRIVFYAAAVVLFVAAATGKSFGKATSATFLALGLACLAFVPFWDAVDAA